MMYQALRIFLLVFVTLSSYSARADTSSISFLPTTIDTGGVKFAGRAAANVNSVNTVSTQIKVNRPSNLRHESSLTIEAILPYTNSTHGTCDELNDKNVLVVCTARVQLIDRSHQIKVDGKILSSRHYTFKKNKDHSFVVVLNTALYPIRQNSIIQCSYKIKILNEVREIGMIYDFKFKALLNDGYEYDARSNVTTLKVIGPRVSIRTDPPTIVMEAGQQASVKFIIEVHPLSTANPADLKIYAGRTISADLVVSRVEMMKTSPFPVNLTHPGQLRPGDRIEIDAKLQLGPNPHIGHSLDIPFNISYTEFGKKTPLYALRSDVQAAHVRDISDLTSSMPLLHHLAPNSLVPLKIAFKIPKGVLPTLSLVLETQSTTDKVVKGVILRSDIVLAPPLWTPHSHLLRYSFNPSDASSSRLRRRKREVAPLHVARRPAVTIYHFMTSGGGDLATVSLDGLIHMNDVELQSSDDDSEVPVNMKISLTYGKRRRVVRSVPVVSGNPPSLIYFDKRYHPTSTHEGLPKFSVTITVDLASYVTNSTVTDDIRDLQATNIRANCHNGGDYSLRRTRSSIIFFSQDSNCTVYTLTYDAEIVKNAIESFGEGMTTRTGWLYFATSNETFSDNRRSCIYRLTHVVEKKHALHGLTVLLILIGLIIGCLILILIGFLYVKFVNQDVNPFEMDEFADEEDRAAMQETENVLLMGEGGHKGDISTIIGLTSVKFDDTIVGIIINKNRNQIYHDIDSLDVLASIHIDQGLESRYLSISAEALMLMLQNLARHRTLKSDVVSRATNRYHKHLEELDKEITDKHKKESEKMSKRIGKKNKRQMQQLLAGQRKARETLEEDLENEDPEVKAQILDVQKKEHKAERDNLVYQLKLQQDEESEQLRKKYALQKRAMARELQRNALEEVKERNKLNPAQAEWLMAEHRRIQQHLDQRYDAEVARQRVLLEEKLERRRALARKKELEEENQTEKLNTLASQQVNVVRRFKREEEISPEKAEHYMERITEDMLNAKTALDRQKDQQEKALRLRLGERKKMNLEVKAINHKMQADDLVRQLKEGAAQTDELLDPVAYIDAILDLDLRQRNELDQLENGFDEEDTKELIDGYQQAVGETEANIRLMKDQLMQSLREDGVPEHDIARLTEQHNRELQQLEAAHDEERQIQDENFRAKLKARKKELEERLSQERQEQEGLRAHENQMVETLLLNQVSISDEERARILMEHERNLVQVENSLTLSKLRQKRMLEEALAERKAKQMQKLQQKQEAEARAKLRIGRGGDSDDEEDRDNRDVLEMLKRHEDQKLELLHGDATDIEDEMENVRTKLMEERAAALKEQEERIAGMLSGLQIEKAKELARIEEQQKAINNLKMNLMEDLSERGVLSDDRCQQIIARHQEEQEGLVERLNNQRNRQEQQLRDRLQERMRQREQQLTMNQQQQLEQQLAELPQKQKMQGHIRRAMLMNRHMLEMEQFRNRVSKESKQGLEEAKRQFDLKKEEYLQEQELSFIAGLVRLGKFRKAELLEVLRLLFPLKSSEELQRILDKIHSGKEVELRVKDDQEADKRPELRPRSSLLDRTHTYMHTATAVARFKELRNSPKRRSNRGNIMSLPIGGEQEGLTPIDRPDPLGQDSPTSYPDTPAGGRGGDLPPLEPRSSKKKKRKKSKKHRTPLIDEEEEAEDGVINVRA